jgi:cell division initiation protein
MNKDLMPIDIVNHKFRQGLKGYVQAEVDDFMGQVADAYGKALEENERLKQELEKAERALLETYMHLLSQRTRAAAERAED